MAVLDKEPHLADVFGCPEFFITDIFTENAGGGCVRLYGIAKHNGVWVPQYSAVMPYRSMLASANKATLAAIEAHQADILSGALH